MNSAILDKNRCFVELKSGSVIKCAHFHWIILYYQYCLGLLASSAFLMLFSIISISDNAAIILCSILFSKNKIDMPSIALNWIVVHYAITLHWLILYRNVLCYTALYCSVVLCCIVFVLRFMTLYSIVLLLTRNW